MLFMALTILPSFISGGSSDGKVVECCQLLACMTCDRAGAGAKLGRMHGVRMDPQFLEMAPLHELQAEGAWLFPKLRLVELYLAFFRVWLWRELQRGKNAAHIKFTAEELDEKVAAEEARYLDFCRRLAFAMSAA